MMDSVTGVTYARREKFRKRPRRRVIRVGNGPGPLVKVLTVSDLNVG